MAWSADGQRLAIAASLDVRVTIVDVSTGRPLPAPGEQFGGVDALAYSPDGRYLAVIRHGTGPISDPSGRYTVSLWDARTAAFVRNIVEPGRSEITSLGAHALAFSSDGRSLAVAYLKQTAIYTIGDGGAAQRVSILPPASRCAFRPGAPVVACLATGPRPRALVLHEVPGGGVIAPPAAHGSNLSWSPDGRWLAIADDQQIGIHDISRARDVTTVSTPDPGVQFRSVSFSSDGRWLAAASYRRLEVWETATWSHAASLGNRQKFIAAAAFSPRGRLLAAVGDAPVDIWDLR
jgi:WD40 repeat protein